MDISNQTIIETMQNNPVVKVSVIMPAFNCASFVAATIASITNQTLKELELIIINDGSTDQTNEVLELYAQSDSRIHIIDVENGGPAKARNIGIDQATGDYLYFIDSDDLIDNTMLEDMLVFATSENLDVCACGYTMENNTPKKSFSKEFNYHNFVAHSKEDFYPHLMPLIKAHLMYVVWNKLFKTSFLNENNLRFTDFLSGEDRLFNANTFEHINRFGFIAKPYYRYFLRGQTSLANRYIKDRFEAALICHKAFTKTFQQMNLYSAQNKTYLNFFFIKSVMACITQLNSNKCPLTYRQKLDYIDILLHNEYVKDALMTADKEIAYSSKVNAILKSGNKTLIYLTGKTIFLLQFRCNHLFLNIKHKLK